MKSGTAKPGKQTIFITQALFMTIYRESELRFHCTSPPYDMVEKASSIPPPGRAP